MLFLLEFFTCIAYVTCRYLPTSPSQPLNYQAQYYQPSSYNQYNLPTYFPSHQQQGYGSPVTSNLPSPGTDPTTGVNVQPPSQPTTTQSGGQNEGLLNLLQTPSTQSGYPSSNPPYSPFGQMNPSPGTGFPQSLLQPQPNPQVGGQQSGEFFNLLPTSSNPGGYPSSNPPVSQPPPQPTTPVGGQSDGLLNLLPGSNPSSPGQQNQSTPHSFLSPYPNPIYQNYPPNYQVPVVSHQHYQVPPLSYKLPVSYTQNQKYPPSYQNYLTSNSVTPPIGYKPVLVSYQPNSNPGGYYYSTYPPLRHPRMIQNSPEKTNQLDPYGMYKSQYKISPEVNSGLVYPFGMYKNPYESQPVVSPPQQSSMDPFDMFKSPYQSSQEVATQPPTMDPANNVNDVFHTDFFETYQQVSGSQPLSQPPSLSWNPLDEFRTGIPPEDSDTSLFPPILQYQSSVKLNYKQKPTTWRHRHASDWYGTCATGQEQSPIDIDTYSVIDLLQNEEFPLTEFHEAMTNGTLENDGHTVRFLPSQELTLIGGGLEGDYKLAELNFRWGPNSMVGSEHTFDKQASAMELQFFFYNTKYEDFANSTKHPDGVAALGVLYDSCVVDNEELNPIIYALPHIRTGEYKISSHGHIKLRNLLPVDTKSFYRYRGSMTTPPCDEVVNWTVFNERMKISERQLKELRALLNYEGQYVDMTYR